MKNLILKSGFRLLRIDLYEDIKNEKVATITCAEQGDDIEWEDTATFYLTEENIKMIKDKLDECLNYIKKKNI